MKRLGATAKWMGELDPSKRYTVSKTPITAFMDRSAALSTRHKPWGLWYSCGPGWIEWIKFNTPEWLRAVRFVYEVIPNLDRVIELNTPEEVLEFNERFGENIVGYAGYPESNEVRWGEVAAVADGIEICPYQSDVNTYRYRWYEGWDVASGCIWRLGGLKELRLVAER